MALVRKMVLVFLRPLILRNRELFYQEAGFLNGFMHLLMKQRNTGEGWSREEKAKLKSGLKHLSFYVPALVIFFLPGGSLLLPFLAEILDRRKQRRPLQ